MVGLVAWVPIDVITPGWGAKALADRPVAQHGCGVCAACLLWLSARRDFSHFYYWY